MRGFAGGPQARQRVRAAHHELQVSQQTQEPPLSRSASPHRHVGASGSCALAARYPDSPGCCCRHALEARWKAPGPTAFSTRARKTEELLHSADIMGRIFACDPLFTRQFFILDSHSSSSERLERHFCKGKTSNTRHSAERTAREPLLEVSRPDRSTTGAPRGRRWLQGWRARLPRSDPARPR